jgi:diguanylate cyclase (GGDEF)-like protein
VEAKSPIGTGRRADSPSGRLAREVSALQAALLGKLHDELAGGDSALFASAAQKLAQDFGAVTATAVGALLEGNGADPRAAPQAEAGGAAVPGEELGADLHRPGAMRRRLDQLVEIHKRYGHPFGLAVFDAEGPGTRNGDSDTVQAVLGAALHDSVRLVDETFRLGEGALCVLAPDQDTVGGVRMAERLLRMLDELEAAGGLRIGITAGVVACPEHGSGAETLLHKADEAMWRARAVGQPVGVGPLDG